MRAMAIVVSENGSSHRESDNAYEGVVPRRNRNQSCGARSRVNPMADSHSFRFQPAASAWHSLT